MKRKNKRKVAIKIFICQLTVLPSLKVWLEVLISCPLHSFWYVKKECCRMGKCNFNSQKFRLNALYVFIRQPRMQLTDEIRKASKKSKNLFSLRDFSQVFRFSFGDCSFVNSIWNHYFIFSRMEILVNVFNVLILEIVVLQQFMQC